ncbi:MAG TPA: pyridoxamine 5'-phosphate oxidase family protein [Acidimicrobiales bacterium]|nr:pyridoxamine 5'-phosphate oxidase family protein [Acidimicrobiales bacterium]
MNVDQNGLEVLTRAECLDLLASSTFGRIALTSQALPLVLPVNYRYDGRSVVIRTNPGTKLDAATRHAVVAFEVDSIDPIYHCGWSVVVQGIARAVDDQDEIARLRQLPLSTWMPAAPDSYVAISLDIVSGRRIPKAHRQGVPFASARMGW